ncbi:MAG: hypothetical protein LBK53_03190 [Heliobacteriaceae bacterium]|jgi:hypothetical protein|nr:hypothetical protein [Heliobacteriaceae bacterium]
MDLSGNQIKLLNLTGRININYDELRKHILENRTSDETSAEEVYFKLTPAELMTYGENKEQYGIIDLSNRIYVTPDDAENYISANNLMQFLSKYGIVDYEQIQAEYDKLYTGTPEAQGVALQITELQNNKPDAVPAQDSSYWSEVNGTEGEQVYADYKNSTASLANNAAYSVCCCLPDMLAAALPYEAALSTPAATYNAQPEASVQTIQISAPSETKEAVQDNAVQSDNILQTSVEIGNYTASTGETLNITSHVKTPLIINDGSLLAEKANVAGRIAGLRSTIYAAQRQERLNPDVPLEAGTTDLSRLSVNAQRLFSNYEIDSSGNYVLTSEGERQLKTLKQKIVDVYYIANNYINLEIPPGETQDNIGNSKNKETDVTVRGAWKSLEQDIQKAAGAEGFDNEKFSEDYAAWADNYARLCETYDTGYENLQKLQEPEDSNKADWYSNLWYKMGGIDGKLGSGVKTEVVTAGYNHGHGAHGTARDYSNEVSRSFYIPPAANHKTANQYTVLENDKMENDAWLKEALSGRSVVLERLLPVNSLKALSGQSAVDDNVPSVSERPAAKHHHVKEYENLKRLTQDEHSFKTSM